MLRGKNVEYITLTCTYQKKSHQSIVIVLLHIILNAIALTLTL